MARKVKSKLEPGTNLFISEDHSTTSTQQQMIKPDPNPPSNISNNVAAAEDGDDLYDDDSQEEAVVGRFSVNETLPNPISAQRNLGFLLELLQDNLIDLDPDYQRKVVWTPDRQMGLINSLIENFYVPPIIFNIEERPTAEGSEETRLVRICVDGKQRLSSVLRFVRGLVPCVDSDGYRWWWNRDGGRNRNVLDEEFKERFLAKQFICIEYTNLSDTQQEELFGRVQKGMMLSEAEKLKAQRGPWQDMALDFEEDFKSIVALSQNRRASGFRNILTVMAQIMELQTVDTKMDRRAADTPALQAGAASLKKFVTLEKDKHTTANINLIAWIFRLWDKIRLKDSGVFQNNNFKVAKNFAPIEFLTVGVLLFRYGHNRTVTMLKGDILALRFWLRERNYDLRTNSKCWRDCWEFLEHLEALRGESGQWTDHDIPPALDDDGVPNRPARAGTSGERGNGKGRRKGVTLDAILARAEQTRGPSSQNSTPKGIINPRAKPGASTSTTKLKTAAMTTVNGNSTSSNKGKKGGLEVYNNSAASSSTSGPATTPHISKVKSILSHRAPPFKGPIVASTMRSSSLLSSSSSSSSSSDDSDDESPRPAHQHRAPPAPMISSNSSTSTTTPVTKRKRLSVKTADGASQLLFKRKKHAHISG